MVAKVEVFKYGSN